MSINFQSYIKLWTWNGVGPILLSLIFLPFLDICNFLNIVLMTTKNTHKRFSSYPCRTQSKEREMQTPETR